MDSLTKQLSDAVVIGVNKAILARVAENPSTLLINLEDANIEAIEAFLKSKRSATWSTYSIGSDDTLEKAARWFQKELNSLYTFLYRVEEYGSDFK